jgi:PTS system mannitol-specific IIC component
MAPPGNLLPVFSGVLVATVVSFLVASVFVRGDKSTESDFEEAKESMVELKGKESSVVKTKANVNLIVVACDAGMGSSAMGATRLRQMVDQNNLGIKVINSAIENIPAQADIVITQDSLTDRAKSAAPKAQHVSIGNFMETGVYEALVEDLKKTHAPVEAKAEAVEAEAVEPEIQVLSKGNIHLNVASEGKWEAIERVGKLLVEAGYVQEGYIPAMKEREELTTTYIGNHVAIPHGVGKAKDFIDNSGFIVMQYPEGVDFGDGNIAYLVIGIAGKGNEHISILSNIAKALADEESVLALAKTADVDEIYSVFTEEVK